MVDPAQRFPACGGTSFRNAKQHRDKPKRTVRVPFGREIGALAPCGLFGYNVRRYRLNGATWSL
jgi:hypothetical protein